MNKSVIGRVAFLVVAGWSTAPNICSAADRPSAEKRDADRTDKSRDANHSEKGSADRNRDDRRDDRGSRSEDNRWRYRFYSGHWWYWLPSEQWVYWDNGAWRDFGAAAMPYGARQDRDSLRSESGYRGPLNKEGRDPNMEIRLRDGRANEDAVKTTDNRRGATPHSGNNDVPDSSNGVRDKSAGAEEHRENKANSRPQPPSSAPNADSGK